MTDAISEIYEELVEGIKATGYKVLDHVPEQPAPPVICLAPGDPYVTQSAENLGRRVLNVEMILIVKTKKNKFMSRDLNQMIVKVLETLDDGWDYTVNQPLYGVVLDDYQLYSVINLSTEFEL